MSSSTSLLDVAKRYFERGDAEKSLEACLAYLTSFPDDHSAIRLKAKLLGTSGNLAEAIQAITKAIDLVRPSEPCDFFYRGRWLLRNGQTEVSCRDFNRVIELSIDYNDNYYVEAANLHLAYAHAMSGNKVDAEISMAQLNDESITSINDTVVTKGYIRKLLR